MLRSDLRDGITRVVLDADDAGTFTPLSFRDTGRVFLCNTEAFFSSRPVRRLSGNGEQEEIRQTANGEVISFAAGDRTLIRTVHSAVLRFSCPGTPVLTGLGAHEDGIFDYACRDELLYEHNMKIPIPFLLSSDGWGLLIEAGCAMKYHGEGNAFSFELDAVEAFPTS